MVVVYALVLIYIKVLLIGVSLFENLHTVEDRVSFGRRIALGWRKMGSCDPAKARTLSDLVFEIALMRLRNLCFNCAGSLNLGILLPSEQFVSLVAIGINRSNASKHGEALTVVNVINLQELRKNRVQHLLL